MHTYQSSLSFLSLPPEIRHMIYLQYFKALSIGRHRYRRYSNKNSLAILQVCRLIYQEAEPLAIPNLRVECHRNADVIDVLSRMSPVQITQLRCLRVWQCVVGFKLFAHDRDSESDASEGGTQGEDELDDELLGHEMTDSEGELSDSGSTNDHDFQRVSLEGGVQGGDEPDDGIINGENHESGREDTRSTSDDDDDDDDDDAAAKGVRYFHLGAVLGLFPGLQLDLLRVHCGVGGGPYTNTHTSQCFKSLLAVDGYRRLWMDATSGDSEPWHDILSLETWRDDSITRFHSCSERKVRLQVPSYAAYLVDQLRQNKEWENIQAGKIDLIVKEDSDESGSDSDSDFDPDHEGTVELVIDRGNADVAVKRDGSPILRCACTLRSSPRSSRFYNEASDALRKLFQENSWETIKAMDGFYDGTEDPEGGTVYSDYWY